MSETKTDLESFFYPQYWALEGKRLGDDDKEVWIKLIESRQKQIASLFKRFTLSRLGEVSPLSSLLDQTFYRYPLKEDRPEVISVDDGKYSLDDQGIFSQKRTFPPLLKEGNIKIWGLLRQNHWIAIDINYSIASDRQVATKVIIGKSDLPTILAENYGNPEEVWQGLFLEVRDLLSALEYRKADLELICDQMNFESKLIQHILAQSRGWLS